MWVIIVKYPYTGIHCADLFPEISKAKLEVLASSRNWKLPHTYVDFLLEHNGVTYSGKANGKLLVYQHSMDLATDEDGLSLFHQKWPPKKLYLDFCGNLEQLYGFSTEDDFFDIRRGQERFGFNAAVPANFVAIGGSGFMTSLALCLEGDWNGMIFHWTPPANPTLSEELNTLERLQFVAKDFADFWQSLVEVPIGAFKD